MKTIYLKVKLVVPDDYHMDDPDWTLEDAFDPHSEVHFDGAVQLKSEENEEVS